MPFAICLLYRSTVTWSWYDAHYVIAIRAREWWRLGDWRCF